MTPSSGTSRPPANPRPEFGFFRSYFGFVENFGAHTRGGVGGSFGVDFGHLFFVGCYPERAARLVFHGVRQLWNQLLPERAGVAGQIKLSGRIVHDDDVSHACGGCASAGHIALDHADTQTRLGALSRAGAAYDTGTDDEDVVVLH